MEFSTADLCDAFPERLQLVEPLFREFGGIERFAGPIETLQVFEDNSLVRSTLESEGQGRVLVVDGGRSLRRALVGGRLATLAHANGWNGLVVNGAVRDWAELRRVPIGIRALNTSPWPSAKKGVGQRGGNLRFAGVMFQPGHFLYADEDGILLADQRLIT